LVWKAPILEKLITLKGSEDGRFCCGGGASGVLYLWDAFTGTLLAQWQSHFNEVLAISFLGAGSEMIISGGKDSMVHCWMLQNCLRKGEEVTPFRSWSGHALPVTSLHCTGSRVVSSSLDHTCKVWSITSDEAVSSTVFPSAITCVAMDESESAIYAGSR
jgi:pre-rRNA-processing protein IPI3